MNCSTPYPSSPIPAIATPTGCDCDTATGGQVSTGPIVGATSQSYQFPVTTSSAVVPSGNALFSVQSPGAPLWAATGMLVWFPELEGFASVRSVIGDVLTLRSLTIPAGSTVQVGTRMVPAPPAQSEADSNPEASTQLTSIQGLNDGLPSLLQGTLGDTILHNGSGWGRVKSSPFVPLPTRPIVLTVKRDVVKGGVSPSWSTPIWGGSGNSPAPEFVTFPGMPTLAVGQQPRALVEVRYALSVQASSAHRTLGVTVNFSGGFSWRKRAFCQYVTATGATIPAQVADRANEGVDLVMIPVIVSGSPPEAQQMTVTTERTISSGSENNAHYIIEFRVLGYFV
jgi:hypothetical protein